MNRVLIIGAGAQGGPCASILAREESVSEILLGDIDVELSVKVKERIGSDKITPIKIDAGKRRDLERAAQDVDIIFNLTLCRFNNDIMRTALNSGAFYIDSAFHEATWENLIEKGSSSFDEGFKKAKLTALIGCGGAPGITGILARYTCDKLDEIQSIFIRAGGRRLNVSKGYMKTWEPTWCPEVALGDFANKPTVFEDAEYRKYPAFSGCEEYEFPEPVGSIEISYHHHEEPLTLPHFIGKGIKQVWFKYPADPIVLALVKLGFSKSDPIDVKGVKVVPRDVLMEMIHKPVDSFLSENEDIAKRPPDYAHLYVLEIVGKKAGENKKYIITWPFSLYKNAEEQLEIFKRLGTTKISVALPMVVGAKMCMEGDAGHGVIFPECLNPMKFMRRMSEMGWPLNFTETALKEVCIS